MYRLLFVLLFTVSLSATEYIIYVNSQINHDVTIQRWIPTIDFLNEKLAPDTFTILPICPNNIPKIKNLLSKKKIDFILTQPAIYSMLEHSYNTTRMLTLTNRYDMSEFGSVIFTYADSPLSSIEDIKGKSVAAIAPMGFGGWLIGYNELYEHKIDPIADKKVIFVGSQKKVLLEVLRKKYDAGVVRTGMIERFIQTGLIDENEIKIINPIKNDYNIYLSTKLFPEWSFAAAEHVNKKIINKVFKALNSIEPDTKMAIEGQYTDWHLPGNYTKVDDLFRRLKIGHYKNIPKYDMKEIKKIAEVSLLTFVLFIVTLFLILRNLYIKKMKTRLKQEVEEKTKELNILNSELTTFFDVIPDIVLINDGERLLRVNKRFLDFLGYESLEKFREKYRCICDLFENREGYLRSEMDGVTWMAYIIMYPMQLHRAIIVKDNVEYIFIVNAKKFVSQGRDHFVVLFEDITRLQEITSTDTLTKVANRIKIDEHLLMCKSNYERYKNIFSVILIDIDYFKVVNDTYGHLEGDRVLKELALLLKENLRETDIIGRWGGEEFLIISENTAIGAAYTLAQKLREKVEVYDFQLKGSLTISCGVAEYCSDMNNIDDLIKEADDALYEAKHSGRNRVVTARLSYNKENF